MTNPQKPESRSHRRGRPPIDNAMVPVTFLIDPGIREALVVASLQSKVPVSVLIRQAINDRLKLGKAKS